MKSHFCNWPAVREIGPSNARPPCPGTQSNSKPVKKAKSKLNASHSCGLEGGEERPTINRSIVDQLPRMITGQHFWVSTIQIELVLQGGAQMFSAAT